MTLSLSSSTTDRLQPISSQNKATSHLPLDDDDDEGEIRTYVSVVIQLVVG